ncbi:conserved hypothetical protein [Culex quinquefasciatus]|uniref:Uncharacterized protein n=1 Tax=Culex quinquefasciatus TaxID=7176 RepID=B0WMX3_CULQU|nr:conserved hypothetical protein [Culex quinquefasciatus]|eukprot:XP_001850057.1 conserved hypothetical protein [Culex quinquefasciatus]
MARCNTPRCLLTGEPLFYVFESLLHQNRADRGPEKSLTECLDLVIWSKEHGREPGVSQPGSTVATSLAEGESFDKRCGILSIHKNLFRMNPIKPQTTVVYVADELQLDEGDVQQKVQNFAAEKLTGNQKQPKFPLIRPRIECLFREWPLLQAAPFPGADTPDTGTNELVPTADFSPPPNALRHFIAASRITSELIRTV